MTKVNLDEMVIKKSSDLCDLHIHTTSSDGEYDCLELLQKIIKQGKISVFSYTNHNNIDDNYIMKKNKIPGLTYINGCEFSSSAKEPFRRANSQNHILGYNMDLDNPGLHEILNIQQAYNAERFKLLTEELEFQGISFNYGDIDRIMRQSNYNRIDIALLLMHYGIVSSVEEAFIMYLSPARLRTEHREKRLRDYEIIEAIKQAGGQAVLAHPITNNLKLYELKEYLSYLKDVRLDGIEVYHPKQDNGYRQALFELAEDKGFLVSGGTDYHGPNVKPEIELGTGNNNNIKIKELSLVNTILDDLK